MNRLLIWTIRSKEDPAVPGAKTAWRMQSLSLPVLCSAIAMATHCALPVAPETTLTRFRQFPDHDADPAPDEIGQRSLSQMINYCSKLEHHAALRSRGQDNL